MADRRGYQLEQTTTTESSSLSGHSIESVNNAASTTEHDWRFPRRPDESEKNDSVADVSDSSRYATNNSSSVMYEISDKPSPVAVEEDARKELMRESFFPNWKDDAASAAEELDSPEEMQKKDPLAFQIWRLYSKTKKQIPNQDRMENLTWRMMHMKMKGRQQEAAR